SAPSGRAAATQQESFRGRRSATLPPSTTDDEHLRRAVSRVIQYMHEHLADPISADRIAETAHFSKFHFSRVFQRMSGDSPGRYLTELRFERAKELLLTTDLRVIDISYEVGFASVGTFSTRFRSRTGLSPSSYRRQFRTRAPMSRYQRPTPTSAVA